MFKINIDEYFKITVIKLLFCNDNFSYKVYNNELSKTTTIKDIVNYAIAKVNEYYSINISMDDVSIGVSNVNHSAVIVSASIENTDIDVDLIEFTIDLDEINSSLQYVTVEPDGEMVEL